MKRTSHACLLLAAALALAAAPAHAAAPLSALTVRLTDLRPGYVVSESRYRTPASIAAQQPLLARQLRAHGWIDGYDARYERATDTRIQVGEFADQFESVAGAHWWYGASIVRVPAGYHSVAMPRVGDESTAVQSAAYVGIIFRRGVDVLDIYVSMLAPAPQASALWLARVVDRRLLLQAPQAAATPVRTAAPTVKVVRKKTRTSRSAAPIFAVRTWVQHQNLPDRIELTLYARAVPGARCVATVADTTPKPHIAFSGYYYIVNSTGVTYWRWHEPVKGASGTATVTCTYNGQSKIAKTTFQVR